MHRILHQLPVYRQELLTVQQSVILFAGLLLLLLSVIYIVFVYLARTQQNRLILRQQAMHESFQKLLLESRLEIQEQTFNDISQEIHDNVGQILSLAKIQVNIMKETHNLDSGMLDAVKENIGKAMADLRDIAGSLNSEKIRSLSIHATVGKEVERINKTGIIRAVISTIGEEREMNEQKKLILLRIIQECLQNCIKHSAASEISLDLHYAADAMEVSVSDNGKGFRVDGSGNLHTGLGLLNIRSRANLAGGSSSIDSALDKGTRVHIKIPYE